MTSSCVHGVISSSLNTIINATANVTSHLSGGDSAAPSKAKLIHEWTYTILYGYGLPTLCVIGFFGNVLNCVVLPRKMRSHVTAEGTAATLGLLALAVADMSFCVTAFPSTYLPEDNRYARRGFLLYYGCYCPAVINIFIMTSTWLTVVMATDRYRAICRPLRSNAQMSPARTKVVIVFTYLASAMFNLPVFWRYRIETHACAAAATAAGDADDVDSVEYYELHQQHLMTSKTVDHVYKLLWALVGNIVPFVLLCFFYNRLTTAISQSTQFNRGTSQPLSRRKQQDSARITATLNAIVVMFLLLVAPSEIVKEVVSLIQSDLKSSPVYLTAELITNFMQTINFTANFILYCIVNKSFRAATKQLLCCGKLQRHDGYNVTQLNDQTSSVRRKISSRKLLNRTPSHRTAVAQTQINTQRNTVLIHTSNRRPLLSKEDSVK